MAVARRPTPDGWMIVTSRPPRVSDRCCSIRPFQSRYWWAVLRWCLSMRCPIVGQGTSVILASISSQGGVLAVQ
jgi:hypothetical protein